MSVSEIIKSLPYLFFTVIFVFILNFFWPIWPVRNPGLSVAIRDCIAKSDYICIVKLAHANPPDDRSPSSVGVTADDRKQEFLRKTAITLGLLGETEMALNIYRNQYYGQLHYYILSAVIANYFVTDQDEKAHGLLSEINSPEKKLRVLGGVQSFLYRAQPSLRENEALPMFGPPGWRFSGVLSSGRHGSR